MLIQRNLVRVDEKTLDKYLSLYANEKSVTLDDEQIKALNTLYEIGHKAGLLPEMGNIKNYMIPAEYKALRMS